jgi:nucleotide-binding universal stress UspA family protein
MTGHIVLDSGAWCRLDPDRGPQPLLADAQSGALPHSLRKDLIVLERILVAIDASDARLTALSLAGEMARLANARVHLVHVATSMVSAGTVLNLEEDDEGKAVLEESLTRLRELGVEAEGHLVRGLTHEVPAVISAAAEDFKADLIVVSPHHRSAFAAFFNPRVSDAVAHASRTAVLLTPEAPATS